MFTICFIAIVVGCLIYVLSESLHADKYRAKMQELSNKYNNDGGHNV